MAEYIEREKIGLTDFEIAICKGDYKEAFKMLLEKIESTQAADVRPVVLCRDCRHWDTDWTPTHVRKNEHFCPNIGLTTREDWFCADGEEREES